jgi:hypothetical protein
MKGFRVSSLILLCPSFLAQCRFIFPTFEVGPGDGDSAGTSSEVVSTGQSWDEAAAR